MLDPNPELQWFALVVKTQHEKMVASLLDSKGYEQFLPLYSVRRRWSDRIKQLELPLFPGYVFCRFDLNKRLPILVTPAVLLIVGAGRLPPSGGGGEISPPPALVQFGGDPQPRAD